MSSGHPEGQTDRLTNNTIVGQVAVLKHIALNRPAFII